MSIERVRAHLAPLGLADRIRAFEVSSATVELAAQAVGVIPARIAKTLSFQGPEGCLILVCAGDAKVDNTKYKAAFGVKAKMLAPEDAFAATGYAVGGVCPFDLGDIPVYLDVSLQRFDTIYPAAGNTQSAVELTCEELYRHSNARAWVDACKAWQEETL